MATKVRAKVLISVLLFVVIAIPAILIPTISSHQADASPRTTYDNVPIDPLQWETKTKLPYNDWQLEPGELEQYLEQFLGE